ncbi:MAG: META domain-containing protein [Chloroflexi bacterium]|nr:META domain-containing protein [Chloroflexota bacterium]
MTTRMTPLRILLLAATLLVVAAACGSGDPAPSVRDGHPGILAGTSWRVVSVAGRTPTAGSEPTIAFANERAQGSGGCNSWSGAYQDEANGGLRFGDLAMTAMACLEDPKNALETAFMTALSQANLASTDPRGLLVLSGPGGQIFLANATQPNPTD